MLYETIQKMTKDEARNFRLQMERVSRTDDKKTILLYELLRESTTKPSTSTVTKKLYGQDNATERNNLYSIRRRLMREIKRSMLHQYFEIDHEQQALNEFSFAKVQRKNGNLQLCKSALIACLKIARKHDLFEIMEMVFKELLNLAPDDQTIEVDEIIKLRTENSIKMMQIRESHNKIAHAIQMLRKSNFSRGDPKILKILEEVRSVSISQEAFYHSSKGRIRLFNLTSGILLRQGAFDQLERYLKLEYAFFQEKKLFDRNTHRTKIIMLSWLVNATYKNNKFQESLDYCFEMRDAMEMYSRRFFNSFIGHLFNSFVNNYVCLDRLSDALSIQLDLIENEKANLRGSTEVFIHLNLVAVYFYMGKVSKALKALSNVKILDSFKSLDPSIHLQIEIFESVLRFEDEDFEYVQTLVGHIKKNYSNKLPLQPSENKFLSILMKLSENRLIGSKKKEKEILRESIDHFKPGMSPEGNLIDYGLWLSSCEVGKSYHILRLKDLME